MAVQFMDSCDHYNQNTTILLKWNATGGSSVQSTPNGRNGRGLLMTPGNVSKSLTHQNGWVVGWAINLPTGAGGLGSDFYYKAAHAGETTLFSVYGETDGSISLYAGNGRHTLLQNSGANGFFLKGGGIWYWFDVKYSLSGSSNISVTATFRVNTQVWCTGSGNTGINVNDLLLQTATVNYHTFQASTGGNTYFDDFVIADMSGSGTVNDFFGDTALSALFPDGDVKTDWNQSAAGSAFVLVNQQFPDNDSTYIYSDTVGDIENFTWQNTTVPPGGSIVAAHYGVFARKDAEGSRSFTQQSGPSAAPDFTSVAWYVGDTYAYYFTALDADPATGVAWTESGFNATDFGQRLNS